MKTKKYWEMHAEQDPYWAVVTWDKFREVNHGSDQLVEFFETGEKHISNIFEVVRFLRPGFLPRTVLDFGCGVGRLLVPLAGRGLAVSGVDISEKMLAIARENLTANGAAPVDLVTSVGALPDGACYDLVHSFITIQHIPVRDGIQIFALLLDRVAPDGVAALHVTYSPAAQWTESLGFYLRARLKGLILSTKVLTRVLAWVRGRALTPPILMENYPLNDLFSQLHDRGFDSMVVRPSCHGPRGLVIFATRSGLSGQF